MKQYGHEGSKYSLIVEAANSLFGGEVKKIVVRSPESGDDAIRAEQSSAEDDKPAPAPKKPLIVEKPEVSNEEVKEILDEKPVPKVLNQVATPVKTGTPQKQPQQPTQLHKMPTGDSSYHSDNVNIVMDLFEGKFIE